MKLGRLLLIFCGTLALTEKKSNVGNDVLFINLKKIDSMILIQVGYIILLSNRKPSLERDTISRLKHVGPKSRVVCPYISSGFLHDN